MARFNFGGSLTDFAVAPPSARANAVFAQPNVTGSVYAARTGGSALTDLLDSSGNPATTISSDTNGFINRFQGPDGYTDLWVDFGGSSRFLLRTSDSVDVAIAANISSGSGTATQTAGDGRWANKAAANVFTLRQTAPSFKIGSASTVAPIMITDTLGTNGQRLSIQPENASSTYSAQLELVPGTAVDQTTQTQAQLLLYGQPGTDYERLLVDARIKEFRIVSSRRNAGTLRPITFYLDDQVAGTLTAVAGVQPDGTFRVTTLTLGTSGDASLTRTAAGIITTPGQFIAQSTVRAASGTAQEVRLGNSAGTSQAAINFGSAQDSYIVRTGAAALRTNSAFQIDGNVGFYGTAPVARQTLPAAGSVTASDIRTVLINLGLAQ